MSSPQKQHGPHSIFTIVFHLLFLWAGKMGFSSQSSRRSPSSFYAQLHSRAFGQLAVHQLHYAFANNSFQFLSCNTQFG